MKVTPRARRALLATALASLGACATNQPALSVEPISQSFEVSEEDLALPEAPAAHAAVLAPDEAYVPVSEAAAARLGCTGTNGAATSPVCETAPPSDLEYAAFSAEADRLTRHPTPHCQLLGAAIQANLPAVRMYRTALIKYMGSHRYYGVGHAYEMDDVWVVRVARRIDDLNPRTLAEMKRTLRHEVSHTIGAVETAGTGWTAENYARNCS